MAQGLTGAYAVSDFVEIGGSNISAFGDLHAVKLTPAVQIDFVYGINTQTGSTTTANGGTADTNSGRLRLQTGTNSAGQAGFESVRTARYRQGQGMVARFTGVFTTGVADSTQIIGAGTDNDGVFFGYNGTSFGLMRRRGGSDNWVAQSSWNQDKCDGTGASGFNWDTTKGNVMMITYPYLGYGNIFYWVQNSENGRWILCHIEKYANSSIETEFANPNFPYKMEVENSGNTTNLTMYSGSVGFFISGERSYLGAEWAIDSIKNSITSETNLLNVRNCTTYNGVTNQGAIRLRSLSCNTDNANGVGTIRLKTGVTLGGSPSFTTINGSTADNGVTITSGNSISSYDVAGTGTSGTLFFNICLSRNTTQFIDLTPYDLFIAPATTLTVTAASTASATMQVALNWNEDV